jgi:hypothetical protein
MNQLTIRNIPAAIEAKLRLLAQQSGSSLNQTVIRLLEHATGGKPEAAKRDLSQIAARWSDRDAAAFDRVTELFESVDEEVWR